jgi:hypothetical protein
VRDRGNGMSEAVRQCLAAVLFDRAFGQRLDLALAREIVGRTVDISPIATAAAVVTLTLPGARQFSAA